MAENQRIISIFPENSDLIFIFAQNKPLTVLVVIIFLIVMAISITAVILTIKKRMEKRALMIDQILPAIGSRFGTNVSASEFEKTPASANAALRFERSGTTFNAKIIRTLGSKFSQPKTEYRVEFKLPYFQGQFSIQRKTFPVDFPAQWQPLPVAEMQKDFVYYNLDPQFLPALLEDEKTGAELFKYHNDPYLFEISFENGAFLISVIWNTEDDMQTEVERLERICQTAVVFHDELAKKSF